jgi:3-(3-hydroxy-phenyl)propionate hydroxylase
MQTHMSDADRVLIAGAGPVGQVCAGLLQLEGVPVTVIEKEPSPPRDLRAGSFHPPSLEAMEPLGFTEYLLANGIKVPRWQFRDLNEGVVAEFDLGLLANDTRYPYRLHCEQWKLTQHAYRALKDRPGIEFLMEHEVVGAVQDADKVTVTCRTPAGERRLEGRWLVGADGGRSVIRKLFGFAFEGFTWDELFVVVSTYHDFAQHGFTENAYIADPDHWCGVFKMPGFEAQPELWRFAYGADPGLSDAEVLSDDATDAAMQRFQRLPARYKFAYKSTYRVHQRVTDTFRKGRVLLAGDAAHINNPIGALGMNSGIQDAANLAEKLARVWHGADDALLDRYDRQRRTIANEIVQAMSTANLKRLLERDPKVRAENRDEMRAIRADPRRHYEFVLGSSMIASVRRAAAIQ